MLALLHGYLLDGSGSNLWTQSVARSLCRNGSDVHLVCQEPHPDAFDFVDRAVSYPRGSIAPELLFDRETPYPGRCVLHRPELGETLPVYVTDRYERFSRVVPMVELPDHEIEAYLARNVEVVEAVVDREGVDALHANHAVLMSVVARRVAGRTGIGYGIMPHGSALEYAVKPDPRFRKMAEEALEGARTVFAIGPEMVRRLREVFPGLDDLDEKLVELPLGVDVDLFTLLPGKAGADGTLERRGPAGPEAGERIRLLVEGLEGVPRGRRPEQRQAMLDALADLDEGTEIGDPVPLWRTAADFDGKRPDAGIEDRLPTLVPEGNGKARDPLVLYVGRLIRAKGVHAAVAAFPRILEERPEARLVVVGHGPLREPLECFLWALERGRPDLARHVLRHAPRVEDEGDGQATGTALAWLDALESSGELEGYLAAARRHRVTERVLFTGYLVHRQLRHLFALADAAVFPSMVREAGPLVFLEAMAAGAFPLGTDFGGTAASIAEAGRVLPGPVTERMKLRMPDAPDGGMVEDIARNVTAVLNDPVSYAGELRGVVEREHDWRTVARRLVASLEDGKEA